MRIKTQWLLLFVLFEAVSACGGGSPAARPTAAAKGSGSASGSPSGSPSGSDTEPAAAGDDDDEDAVVKKKTENWLAGVDAMTDDEAIKYLKKGCGSTSCHDSKDGKARSFWPLNNVSFDKKSLVSDSLNARVYYSIVFGAKQIVGQRPSSMPKGTNGWKDDKIAELKKLVKWFENELPAAVQTAQVQFGTGTGEGDGVGVALNFKCGHPSTFRQYINRLAQDAFSRNATPEEMKLTTADLDEAVSRADRKKMSARIFSDKEWKKDFIDHGLKKFADKIAGVNDITKLDGQIDEGQAEDLKLEFYQKIKREWEESSWKDILLSDKVMVSAKTAKLYEGCSASGEWSECQMKAPRDSFFSSIGYLRSKQSSYIAQNNNYGRAALMHFIVRGDVFRNANDQDGGSEALQPLPKCLKSKDFRVEVVGTSVSARGSMAVPSSANLCQSCHIERQMAAGSILYRPYNFAGLLYKKDDPILDIHKDPLFSAAVDATIFNRPKGAKVADPQVALDPGGLFLQALLDDQAADPPTEVGCTEGAEGEPDIIFKRVGDLAKFLIGDGRILAGGLARHVPRAISQIDQTSEEIIIKFNKAYEDGKGKLGPLFESYFASETFACERD